MKVKKPPKKQAAFTLVELILVVIVLAILGSYVLARFSESSSYQVDTVAQQVIAAGRLTQQLAMSDNSNNFSLVLSSNQIDVRIGGTSYTAGEVTYPVNLGSDVTLTNATLTFDYYGATTGQTITVTKGSSLYICFNPTGHIQSSRTPSC